jgi:hypothetical protein
MAENGYKVIRIVACHKSGEQEVLNLHFPFTLRDGIHFTILTDGKGVDYYFDSDGYYDGWSTQADSVDN